MSKYQSRAAIQWSRPWFFTTAFITGAVVMALEFLGSRLLAPVFGSSLFVWGALIGVVLAAMSSGYATGGWLADRRPPEVVLALFLLGSGAWTLLLASIGQPVVFTASGWTDDPRWGPCLAASVLLGVPAFGLSGVLPALLRLAIADMGHLGRYSGGMIAISTIGSLVGTWGTSFYLLSWFGTLFLIAILGVLLAVVGVSWLWLAVRVRARFIILVLVGLGILAWFAFHPILVQPTAVYQEDSPYQQLRVRDNDLFRSLILDNTFHAVMWRSDPIALALPYSHMMMAALGLHPDPKRGLILGQGGGSLAKWLGHYWPLLELDVVEMDPSVVKAAEQFFDYKPPKQHHVYVQDARIFFRSAKPGYDIIWVDVFARHLIPFHLTTREFYAKLRAHLNPDGIIVVNLASSDSEINRKRDEAIVSTLKTSFSIVETFRVPGPAWIGTRPGAANLIIFASSNQLNMRTAEFSSKAYSMAAEGKLPSEVLKLLSTAKVSELKAGHILTDDFAPADILQGSS